MIKTIHCTEHNQKLQAIFEDPETLPDLNYVWIDLLAPTDHEVEVVQQHFSLLLLDKETASDIEASSKVFVGQDLIVMHMVYVNENDSAQLHLTPVWFYLFRHKLLSVRQQNISTFNGVRDTILKSPEFNSGSEIGFLLVSERIDHSAKKMKEMIMTISLLNGKINVQRNLGKEIINELNLNMEYLLMFRISMMNTELTLSHLLLIPSLAERLRPKLKIMQNDVKTLLEYSEFSINRLDYMLTTFTAYISIEQNNSMKIFTMVTVASTPAIFITSFYGMNFQGIPWIHWKYGFEGACLLMLSLTVLSVYWFRKMK